MTRATVTTRALVFLAVTGACGSAWAQSSGRFGGASVRPSPTQLGRGLELQGRGRTYQIAGPRGTVYVRPDLLSRATNGQLGRTRVEVLDRNGARRAETSVPSRARADGQRVSASLAAYQARALHGTARGLRLTPAQNAAIQRNQANQSRPVQRAVVDGARQLRRSELGREVSGRLRVAAVTTATTALASGSLGGGALRTTATIAAGGTAGAVMTLVSHSGAISATVRAVPANAAQNRQQAETTARQQMTAGRVLRVTR